MPAHMLANAKAYATLAGLVATALLQQYGPDGKVGVVCTAVLVIASVFATWRVPNNDPRKWE